MDNVKLIQKTTVGRNEFTLEDDVIHIKSKKNGQKWDYTVRYEQIGFEIMRKVDTRNKIGVYILTACTVLLGAMGGYALLTTPTGNEKSKIWFSMACFSVFIIVTIKGWLARNVEYLYLTGGNKNIEMFSNVPNEAVVESFVEEINTRTRKKHLGNYLRVANRLSPDAQVAQLDWLVSIGAISEQEKNNMLSKTLTWDISLN